MEKGINIAKIIEVIATFRAKFSCFEDDAQKHNAQVFEHNVSNPNPSDGLIANLPDPRHKWNWQEKSRAKLKGLNINKIGKKKKESMKNVTL